MWCGRLRLAEPFGERHVRHSERARCPAAGGTSEEWRRAPAGLAGAGQAVPRTEGAARTRSRRVAILPLVLYGVAVSFGFCPAAAEASEVQAGVARAEFALPKWVPLAGYSRRHGKPSSGVHDPVGVRALVVTDDDTTAALVSCDLLIIDEHLFNAVHHRVLAEGLPQDAVLILAATHTHSGPGAYGKQFLEKLSMGHFDPAVFETLVQTIAQAVVRAYAQRQPSRMAYGTARLDGLVVNRVDPHGPVDDELVVRAFYPAQGNAPFAILVNFAAHPTTLGAWNMEASADYPGVVIREVERQFPSATCLFFAGAVGDQAPTKAGTGFEQAERLGRPMAEQAVALIDHATPEVPREVRGLQERMALPPPQIRLGRVTLPRWVGARLVDDDATLSIAVVGTTAFVGVPCDLTASLGEVLKQTAHAQGLHPVLIGFASDYIGYCVPAALYKAKQYESSMAFNGPHAGDLIVARLIQMIEHIATSDTRQATR